MRRGQAIAPIRAGTSVDDKANCHGHRKVPEICRTRFLSAQPYSRAFSITGTCRCLSRAGSTCSEKCPGKPGALLLGRKRLPVRSWRIWASVPIRPVSPGHSAAGQVSRFVEATAGAMAPIRHHAPSQPETKRYRFFPPYPYFAALPPGNDPIRRVWLANGGFQQGESPCRRLINSKQCAKQPTTGSKQIRTTD